MTVRILHGDCRELLRSLPDASVQCCVTSPPYFGLRDYGVDGQIGLEQTPDAFVAEMVAVFREVRRVLADDGTLWLNLGDSYAGSRGAQSRGGPPSDKSTLRGNGHVGGGPKVNALSAVQVEAAPKQTRTGSIGADGIKPKDLYGVPWMVAFALRADGWWLRQDIVWAKPNPMPESVTDRCTKAHEYLFLLSKSARYYFDAAAIAEPRTQDEDAITFRGGSYTGGNINNGTTGKRLVPGNKSHKHTQALEAGDDRMRTKAGLVAYAERERAGDPSDPGKRNKRSVWTVATQPFSEAHFATFPPALIEPCILAGSREGDTVLDPFLGSGTTAVVADRLGRNCVGVELNPLYVEMARKRVERDAPLFASVTVDAPAAYDTTGTDQLDLIERSPARQSGSPETA